MTEVGAELSWVVAAVPSNSKIETQMGWGLMVYCSRFRWSPWEFIVRAESWPQ